MAKTTKIKIKAKSLLGRIGGVSAFGLGVSWKAPESDRAVVRDVLTFLEDRRALYVGAIMEQPDHVVASVLRMRDELTAALKRVSDDSPAKQSFRVMRAACREFPSEVGGGPHQGRHWGEFAQEQFLLALGRLRGVMGHHVAALAQGYSIDVEEHLAAILPPAPSEDGGEEV